MTLDIKRSRKDILDRCLAVAKSMDKSSAGTAAMYVGELDALLWVLGWQYSGVMKDAPKLVRGERSTFHQDKIKELMKWG